MMIDTYITVNWIKKHTFVCAPIMTAFLSWYAAMRWQVAIDDNHKALVVFYFCVAASSGVTSIILVFRYLFRIGVFD